MESSNDDKKPPPPPPPAPAVAVTQSPIAEKSNKKKKSQQQPQQTQQPLRKIPPETDKALVEYLLDVANHPDSELAQKPFQDFCDETPAVFGNRNSIERKMVRNRREYLRRISQEKFDALVLKILGQQQQQQQQADEDDDDDDMSKRSENSNAPAATPPPVNKKKKTTANKKKKQGSKQQKEKKEKVVATSDKATTMVNNKPNKYPPIYQLQIATDEIFSTLDASNTAIKVVYKKLQNKFGCNKGLDRSQKDAVKVRLQHLIDCRDVDDDDDDDDDLNKPDTPWPDEKILQMTDEMFHAALSNTSDDNTVPPVSQFLHRLHESYHFFMTESVKAMIQGRLRELLRDQNDHRTMAITSTSASAPAAAAAEDDDDDNNKSSDGCSGNPSADVPDDDQDAEEDGNGDTAASTDEKDGEKEEFKKTNGSSSRKVEKKRKSTRAGENGDERPAKRSKNQSTSSSNHANHDDDDDDDDEKLIDRLIANLQANLRRDKEKRKKSLKTAKGHVQVAKKAYEDCLAVVQQLEKDEEQHFHHTESTLSKLIEARRRGLAS